MTTVIVEQLPTSVAARPPWDSLPWSEQLMRANRRQAERSIEVLEGWIPGITQKIRGDITDVEKVATDGRPLYDRDSVDDDLYRLDAADSLRIYHDGELIDIEPFLQRPHHLHRPGIINRAQLINSTHEGYTFNVGTIDRWHPTLNSLAEHLERIIGGNAEVYAFISGGHTPASPLHFDQPELIIVPVEGPKFWDVRRSEHQFAMGPDFVDHGEPPAAFAEAIHPGEALVVPRGWLHKAAPVGEFSLCLTFGLFRQFLARPTIDTIERSTAVAELRRPRTAGFAEDDDQVSSVASLTSSEARRLFTVPAYARWFATSLAQLPTRNDGHIPRELVDSQELPIDTKIRSRVPGGFMAVGDDPQVPRFAGGDKLITTSTDVIPVLEPLLSASGETLEELADRSAHPDVLLIAGARLAAEGVLDVQATDEGAA